MLLTPSFPSFQEQVSLRVLDFHPNIKRLICKSNLWANEDHFRWECNTFPPKLHFETRRSFQRQPSGQLNVDACDQSQPIQIDDTNHSLPIDYRFALFCFDLDYDAITGARIVRRLS